MDRRVLMAGVGAGATGWLVRHRTSPAVRAWKPGGGERRRAGPLAVRLLGGGEGVITALLHGLTGSGEWWGQEYDRLGGDGCVVVPDLLGFGRSLDLDREDFSLPAHLDALDEMMAALGLDDAPLRVVGHSMGSIVAIAWAARRPDVRRVVAFCAPLYDDETEARIHIARLGPLEKLFAMESPLAERTCALMCEFRTLAQWLAVAISPEWPVALSRQGVLHTWPSYLGGMNGIILGTTWRDAVARLDAAGVPVVLANGAPDPVPVAGRAAALAERFGHVAHLSHPAAGHDLPISYADWCVPLIATPTDAPIGSTNDC
ncbi:MAG: alpha/beta fold hydrolase [Egibacteraceae bacterium]